MAEEIIDGYKLQKHMATGQTSQVWEVVETSSHRHFAMKLLLPEKAREAMHRQFLYHEAAVGKELAHPNIIRIVKIGKDPKNPYFVMEFFPAGSLRVRLMTKALDFIRERGQDILKQTATGLAFMNAKGWVHRDVKADNVLVNSAGEVRIIDFALAQRVQKPSFFGKLFRFKAKAQGTRSYISPEQIRGEPLDGRADIYSFGCMAYEMVTVGPTSTGRPPFRGMSSQELLNKHLYEKPVSPQMYNRDVTDEFAGLILRMLGKKRQDRPKDFHEVLMAMKTMKVFKPETAPKSGSK